MRIIEWNCQGAFRKKYENVIELKPDLLIVPECESEKKFGDYSAKLNSNNSLWFGERQTKGIAIFSFNGIKIELHPAYNPRYKHIIPIIVTNENSSINFNLFAIWTKDTPENKAERYIGQLWLAMSYYSLILKTNPSVLIGDLNSNKIWDQKSDRIANHTMVIDGLAKLNIVSLYHELSGEDQGEETKNTFFMYRKMDKPYHIDFCFYSKSHFSKTHLTIQDYKEWIDYSDHSPIVVELSQTESNHFQKITKKEILLDYISSFDKRTQNKFSNEIEEIKESCLNSEAPITLEQSEKLKTISYIDGLIQKLN